MIPTSFIVDGAHPDGPAVAASLKGLATALRPCGVDAQIAMLPSSLAALRPGGRGPAVAHVFGLPRGARQLLRELAATGHACVVSPLGEATTGPYRRRGWGERLTGVLLGSPVSRFVRCVVGVSQAEVDALREQRVHLNTILLPLGVSTADYSADFEARRAAASSSSGKPRTMLVLRPLDPIEGTIAFLKAVADVGEAADGWQIVFAGPAVGDWRTQLEAGIRRKGAAGRVHFDPTRDTAVHRRHLQNASLLVAPSLHPRGDTTVAASAATGVPAVATALTAPPLPAGALRVCAPRREDLAAALGEMLTTSDAELAERGETIRRVALELLDWTVLAPRYAALYHELAGRPGASGDMPAAGSREADAGTSVMRN